VSSGPPTSEPPARMLGGGARGGGSAGAGGGGGGPRARRPGRPTGGGSPAHRQRRLAVSCALMLAGLGGICTKLLFVQGVNASLYQAHAISQDLQDVVLPAERGSILDRNGNELAISVPLTTVCADPYQVANPRQEALALAGLVGVPEATLQAELSAPQGFVYLARTIPDAVAAKVEKLITDGALAGVYTIQEPKRIDPAGQLAAPIIGVVGANEQGLSGLEYKYNSLLEGKPGKRVEVVDPAGGQIPGGLKDYQAPVPGNDLVLSIDEPLQYNAEEALARAIVAAQAKSGMALVMDRHTGDLLAVAELTIPNRREPSTLHEPPALPVWYLPPAAGAGAKKADIAGSQPVEAPTASAFTTVYEPGSVQKLITMSAALSDGVIVPSDVFSIPGSYNVAGSTFNDAWAHPTLHWTVSDILAHSSDIGTIEIAQRLGMSGLVDYLHAFGVGERTDVGFPGESSGLVPGPKQWSGTSIATVPIGQGLAVTAVQMLAAYNTVANDGVYVPPRLVDGYIGPDGREHLFPAAPTRRVVTKRVAQEMTAMLEGVVRVGTGQAANLSPYTVAGKTGTALVPSPTGGYINNYFVSSFAGFVPAEDPAITVMVVVEGTLQYGAEASAPVFAMIARDALQELGVPPHKPAPPVPGVPLATPYGAEGEAAGPVLAGLQGAPAVQVAGGAQVKTPAKTPARTAAKTAGATPATTSTARVGH
jgi:cell division protein FtsI (penicillin-binding protein 3)